MGRRLGRLRSLYAGSICVLVGAGCVVGSSFIFADMARMARLAPITARDLPRLAPGLSVVATGSLDSASVPGAGGLVLSEKYRLELRLGPPGEGSRWQREAEQDPQPAFLLRQFDGVVPVLGGRYSLDNPPHEVLLQHHWAGIQQAGDQSYRGFRRGDTVTIRGSVVSGPEGKALQPESVDSGTREQVLRRDRVAGLLFRTGGIFVLLIGIGQAGGFSRRWRRLW